MRFHLTALACAVACAGPLLAFETQTEVNAKQGATPYLEMVRGGNDTLQARVHDADIPVAILGRTLYTHEDKAAHGSSTVLDAEFVIDLIDLGGSIAMPAGIDWTSDAAPDLLLQLVAFSAAAGGLEFGPIQTLKELYRTARFGDAPAISCGVHVGENGAELSVEMDPQPGWEIRLERVARLERSTPAKTDVYVVLVAPAIVGDGPDDLTQSLSVDLGREPGASVRVFAAMARRGEAGTTRFELKKELAIAAGPY